MEKRCSNRGIIEEEELEDSENIIINEVDGLPNLHPNYEQLEFEFEGERHDTDIRSIDELVHDEDLPTSVIVTNVDPRVFINDDLKVIKILHEILINDKPFLLHCGIILSL